MKGAAADTFRTGAGKVDQHCGVVHHKRSLCRKEVCELGSKEHGELVGREHCQLPLERREHLELLGLRVEQCQQSGWISKSMRNKHTLISSSV